MLESTRIVRGAGCAIVAGLLATPGVLERVGALLPDASTPQIAFGSHRDGNWEIYLTDAEGQQQTRLTRSDPQDRFPLWSPDRSQIAFGSQVGGDHWELWVMNADGTKPRSLATQIVAKAPRQWSHDGTRIVFVAKVEGNAEIMSVDVASGRVVRLTNSPGDDDYPSWSPDDRHIAFSSTRDGNPEIYVMRADGSEPRRLTNDTAPDLSPAWSPDGARIAFTSTRDGDREVYLVRVDDARLDHKRWAAAGSPTYDGQFSWSPASDQLAFISGRDGFDAVYVADLQGKQRRLTGTSSLNPEWSP